MFLDRHNNISGEIEVGDGGDVEIVWVSSDPDCVATGNLVSIRNKMAAEGDTVTCCWRPAGSAAACTDVDFGPVQACSARPWGIQAYPDLRRKECTNTNPFQTGGGGTFEECCTDGYGTPQTCNFCDSCVKDCPDRHPIKCEERLYYYVPPRDGFSIGTCTNAVDFSTLGCGGMGCTVAECCDKYLDNFNQCNIYNQCLRLPEITYYDDPVVVQGTARGLVIVKAGGVRIPIGDGPVVTPVLNNDVLSYGMDGDYLTLDEVWIQSTDGGRTEGDCRASSDGFSVVYTPRDGFAGTALCRYSAKVVRPPLYGGDPPLYPDFTTSNRRARSLQQGGGANPITLFGAPSAAPTEVSL